VSRKVTFHRLARKELNDAAQYYESTSAGLGREFLQEIERSQPANLLLRDEFTAALKELADAA
jgi:hypothetical protein